MAIDTNFSDDIKQNQILQIWFSSSFPIGSFAYSHGLEAMIDNKYIKDEKDILKCIDVLTNHGTLKNDFIYIKETYEGYELNDIVLANAASKERYFETISLGKSFSKILKETWGFDLEPNLSYPICIGKAGLYFKIPFDKLITFYFQSFISNLINICVKHIPLGQKIGQDCLLKSTSIVENFFKIGGPVGAGKTSLTEGLCNALSNKISMAVISNDIYTVEDAEYLMKKQALPVERIKGVETGGCPHTAIREDASINLLAVDEMKNKFPDLDLILIESGGDNLAATFSPELVDLTIYVIDVGMGGDIPRKGGLALKKSDLLIINKTDLAPYVDVNLEDMKTDVEKTRDGLPYIFGQMKNKVGIEEVSKFLELEGGLNCF